MKRLVAATLLTLAAVPLSLLFAPQAKASLYDDCYLIPQSRILRNPADHPEAYADGYSEGRQSARKGKPYTPRTAGGEFARGFEDGYYGRSFTGQQYAVRDKVERYLSEECDTFYVPHRYWGWRDRYWGRPYHWYRPRFRR